MLIAWADFCTSHGQSSVLKCLLYSRQKYNQKTSLGSDPSNVPALNLTAQIMLLWQCWFQYFDHEIPHVRWWWWGIYTAVVLIWINSHLWVHVPPFPGGRNQCFCAELMSKINLLTQDTYCLEIQFAAAVLAQTQTSEWLFLYFAGQRFLWVFRHLLL